MGWFAGGDPAELVAPGEWERIRDLIGPLDYPGTVFGAAGQGGSVPDIAQRYARALALHHRDTVLPPGQHDQLPGPTGNGRAGTVRRPRRRRVTRTEQPDERL
jgi:hypothetical protein